MKETLTREEILERSKRENRNGDERERTVRVQGEHAYDYAAILFAYLAGAQAHQCWKTRRRSAFVAAAVYTFALAANLILFLG